MPGRDRTGPLGRGPMSGRGRGVCAGGRMQIGTGQGMGFGHGRGRGLNCIAGLTDPELQKEILEEQKNLLESRLAMISKQLESVKTG